MSTDVFRHDPSPNCPDEIKGWYGIKTRNKTGMHKGQNMEGIKIAPATATAVSPAGTVQFAAMGKFSNNAIRMLTATDNLTWMSSSTTMVSINSAGMAQW
ncbi:MAG TPA: hypothetical protein VHQ22_12130 [Terriglobales bacterium]|jgi:hypothetical protein|nr:hypothetical protein [Terriglobales bacterium]